MPIHTSVGQGGFEQYCRQLWWRRLHRHTSTNQHNPLRLCIYWCDCNNQLFEPNQAKRSHLEGDVQGCCGCRQVSS